MGFEIGLRGPLSAFLTTGTSQHIGNGCQIKYILVKCLKINPELFGNSLGPK